MSARPMDDAAARRLVATAIRQWEDAQQCDLIMDRPTAAEIAFRDARSWWADRWGWPADGKPPTHRAYLEWMSRVDAAIVALGAP